MFFGIFVLNRVSILSIFVLNRVSFLRQEPITLFLDDKQPALMFYECLKLGIKNRNSVLNRVGKSAIFVFNSTCAFLLAVKLNVSEISRVYTVIEHSPVG